MKQLLRVLRHRLIGLGAGKWVDSGEVLVRGMLVGVGRRWPLRPAGQFVSSVEGVRGGQGSARAGSARAGGLVKLKIFNFFQIFS